MTFIGPAWRGDDTQNQAMPSTSGKAHNRRATAPAQAEGSLQWAQRQRAGAGLRNLGNTCYLNSVLQCLTHTPPLANLALKLGHSSTCTLGACAFCLVEEHTRKSLELTGRLNEPAQIYRQLRSFAKHFQHGRQEDAHELLRVTIEAMHQSCMKLIGRTKDGPTALGSMGEYKVPATAIEKIFGGVTQSQVRCLACGYESNTYEPLMDLSLEVHQIQSVKEALRKMTHIETLSGANAYKCDKCKKLVSADKQTTLHRTPNCLVVHLKRFQNASGGKIQTHIRFDEHLDLTQHLSGASIEQHAAYSLYGVLVHVGSSASSGHYYCFAKDAYEWHQFDDSTVSRVDLQSVLVEGRAAYMLFYLRTAPTPPLDAVVAEDTGPATAAATVMAAADVYHASAPIGPTLPAAVSSQRSYEREVGGGTATSLGKRKAEMDANVVWQRMMSEHELGRLSEQSAQQLQPSRFTSSHGSQVEARVEQMQACAEGPLQLGLARIYRTIVASASPEWRRKIRKLLEEKRKEGLKWSEVVNVESVKEASVPLVPSQTLRSLLQEQLVPLLDENLASVGVASKVCPSGMHSPGRLLHSSVNSSQQPDVPPSASRDTGRSVDVTYHPVPPRMLLRRRSVSEARRHEGMLTAGAVTDSADGLP